MIADNKLYDTISPNVIHFTMILAYWNDMHFYSTRVGNVIFDTSNIVTVPADNLTPLSGGDFGSQPKLQRCILQCQIKVE